eukprot:761649-Hanusia_phi.AAC.6
MAGEPILLRVRSRDGGGKEEKETRDRIHQAQATHPLLLKIVTGRPEQRQHEGCRRLANGQISVRQHRMVMKSEDEQSREVPECLRKVEDVGGKGASASMETTTSPLGSSVRQTALTNQQEEVHPDRPQASDFTESASIPSRVRKPWCCFSISVLHVSNMGRARGVGLRACSCEVQVGTVKRSTSTVFSSSCEVLFKDQDKLCFNVFDRAQRVSVRLMEGRGCERAEIGRYQMSAQALLAKLEGCKERTFTASLMSATGRLLYGRNGTSPVGLRMRFQLEDTDSTDCKDSQDPRVFELQACVRRRQAEGLLQRVRVEASQDRVREGCISTQSPRGNNFLSTAPADAVDAPVKAEEESGNEGRVREIPQEKVEEAQDKTVTDHPRGSDQGDHDRALREVRITEQAESAIEQDDQEVAAEGQKLFAGFNMEKQRLPVLVVASSDLMSDILSAASELREEGIVFLDGGLEALKKSLRGCARAGQTERSAHGYTQAQGALAVGTNGSEKRVVEHRQGQDHGQEQEHGQVHTAVQSSSSVCAEVTGHEASVGDQKNRAGKEEEEEELKDGSERLIVISHTASSIQLVEQPEAEEAQGGQVWTEEMIRSLQDVRAVWVQTARVPRVLEVVEGRRKCRGGNRSGPDIAIDDQHLLQDDLSSVMEAAAQVSPPSSVRSFESICPLQVLPARRMAATMAATRGQADEEVAKSRRVNVPGRGGKEKLTSLLSRMKARMAHLLDAADQLDR